VTGDDDNDDIDDDDDDDDDRYYNLNKAVFFSGWKNLKTVNILYMRDFNPK